MGKRMSVTTLPEDVLRELRKRLVQSNFGNYEAHAEWLRSAGYPISKSAIHRYATEYATGVMSEKDTDGKPSVVEARLRCLEVAASVRQTSTTADLINDAEELLKWVYTY